MMNHTSFYIKKCKSRCRHLRCFTTILFLGCWRNKTFTINKPRIQACVMLMHLATTYSISLIKTYPLIVIQCSLSPFRWWTPVLPYTRRHFKTPKHETNKMLIQMTQIVIKHIVATCLDFSLNTSTDRLLDNRVHRRFSVATKFTDCDLICCFVAIHTWNECV
jgi:hypothetical protein